jgi:serine/threonine-protein kinase
MGLTPGSRFGPYEIRSAIGAGGMGEVYRATDTTLDRDVAIKVLPESHAHDPERLARFQREAKTLAALNHPHIAHIFGLERIDGISALILELVEGPTLADQIAGHGLSVDEALRLAKQIAEALEAAHAQDIVHRDLKPANIKVTADGTVKVLDFGLAKIVGAPQGTGAGSTDPAGLAGLTLSPTITTPAMTAIGVILGTAAYMSPEQAKGREADERSDVWAFGCVLFEMLTGTRAFDGDDVSDTLASVLKSEPDWSKLPADLPLAIRTLLQRCLVKDRRARVSGIAVAQFVLAEASALTAPTSSTQLHPAEERPAKAGHYVRRAGLVAAAVSLAAIVGVAVWWLKPAPSSRLVSFTITAPQRFSAAGRQLLAISPDGSQLVYVGVEAGRQGAPGGVGQRLYLRSLSEFEAHHIQGSELPTGVGSPVFSPDGKSIAFFSGDGWKRLPVTGGTAVSICPAENPIGATWDGSGIVFGQTRGVFRCAADGGTPEQLLSVNQGERAFAPQILPGGQLLFSLAKVTDLAERWDKGQIVLYSLTAKTRTTLINGGSDARYLSTGHLVYALGGTLFAVPFDPGRPEIAGGRVNVIEGVSRAAGAATGAAHLSISANGTLVYRPGPVRTTTTDRLVALADRSGSVTRLELPPKPYMHVRASRDGTAIVLDTDDGKESIVWTHRLASTGEPIRLTFAGKNGFPIISPDGQYVAYQSDRDGDLAIFMQRADGTGPAERLTKPDPGDIHMPESWSPDGNHISYSVNKGGTVSLWVWSRVDKATKQLSTSQPSDEPIGSVFSPDGRWIAYHWRKLSSNANPNDSAVFVQPFPATGAVLHQAPKVNIDFHPLWSPDGRELIYVGLAASGQLAAVSVSPRTIVPFGRPQMLPSAVTMGRASGLPRAFDMLPNGRFIGLVPALDENEPALRSQELRVVLNWLDELVRLVPVK